MAKAVYATCSKCGGRVKIGSGNCVKIDGEFYHAKCPKEKKTITPEERLDYDSLRDRIKKWYTEKPNEYYQTHDLNWSRVIQRVNVMRNLGYSYKDIEYALDKSMEELGAFWGIKQVENRISGYIANKDRVQETNKDLKKYENKEYYSVDLSKMTEERDEW